MPVRHLLPFLAFSACAPHVLPATPESPEQKLGPELVPQPDLLPELEITRPNPVTASRPAAGATAVSLGTAITLTFADLATATDVRLLAGDDHIEAPVVVTATGNDLVLRPERDLVPNLTYRVSIGGDVVLTFSTQSLVWHGSPYVLLAGNETAKPSLFQSANIDHVDGITARITWAALEVAPDVYDWQLLDDLLDEALAHDKKVALSLYAELGVRTEGDPKNFPAWLHITEWFYAKKVKNGVTACERYPAPWDPEIHSRFLLFVAAVGRHLEENPARAAAVSYVNGAGDAATYNWAYGAALQKPSADDSCSDASLLAWEDVISPEALTAILKIHLDTFMSAFPSVPQWFSVGVTGFDGCAANKACVAQDVAAYGFLRYPDRFGLWREDLNAKREAKNPPKATDTVWTLVSQYRPRVGAQMVWSVQDCDATNDPAIDDCRMAEDTSDPATALGDAMAVGSSSSGEDGYYLMPYQEVYKIDVEDPQLTSVFADARAHTGFLGDHTPPPAPLSLQGTRTGMHVVLTWNAVVDRWHAGPEVTPTPLLASPSTVTYVVTRDAVDIAHVLLPGFVDEGAAAGASYTVSAIDAAGHRSELSSPVMP
jgi:hypothetical protein